MTENNKLINNKVEETVNERFIKSVNYLISVKSVKNKTELAHNLRIGRTKLSEILNKRMNVGIDTVALYCLLYEIRVEWLLNGKGKMVRPGEFIPKTPEHYKIYLDNIDTSDNSKSENIDYKELAESRKETIELQKEKIKNLEEEIRQLKKAQENPSGYGMVAESESKLKKK